MIPLRDINPSRTFPYVTIAIILINVIVHALQWGMTGKETVAFYQEFGAIPATILGQYSKGFSFTSFSGSFTLLTSMFIHGGFFHLLGNMWSLWIFGDNVEDRFGHFGFLFFYIVTGIAASVSHILVSPHSMIPTVGASGAISGVMGAYVLLFPRARILVLLPIFIFIRIFTVPAWVFLGFWFFWQLLQGLATVSASNPSVGGVAFWAHIGGFAAGMILIPIMRKQR